MPPPEPAHSASLGAQAGTAASYEPREPYESNGLGSSIASAKQVVLDENGDSSGNVKDVFNSSGAVSAGRGANSGGLYPSQSAYANSSGAATTVATGSSSRSNSKNGENSYISKWDDEESKQATSSIYRNYSASDVNSDAEAGEAEAASADGVQGDSDSANAGENNGQAEGLAEAKTSNESSASAAALLDDAYFLESLPKDHDESAKYRVPQEAQRIDLNLKILCPHCQDPVPNLIEDFKQGDIICASCGTVFKDRIIDTRSEWRTFASDEAGDDPSRVGVAENSLLNNQNQLETVIGFKDGGRGIARELQKTHLKAGGPVRTNRSLVAGFREITTLGERMGLQRNVIEAAKQYYKLADERQLLRGRPELMSAVCLLLGCRKTGNGRTLQEFADLINLSKHDFGRIFKPINQKVANLNNINGEDISARLCNALGLSHYAANMVSNVCSRARAIPEMASRTPATIAGASIYLVSHLLGEPRNSRDIATLVKLSESTVRQGYRIMRNHMEMLLASDFHRFSDSKLPSA